MFVWNENEEIRKRKEREKSEKRKKPVSRARTESRNRKGEIEIRRIELQGKARHEIWSGQAGDVGGLGLDTERNNRFWNSRKCHENAVRKIITGSFDHYSTCTCKMKMKNALYQSS